MKVFVSIPQGSDVKNTFVTEKIKRYLESKFDVVYSPYDRHITAEEFTVLVKDCDAVITGWGHIKITYDMIKDSRVKVIAHTGGTVAKVADLALYDNGIRILSGNVIYAESVAEGTIAYMLTGLRQIPYYTNLVREGSWRKDTFFNEGLLDKTVGIVGMGTISNYLIRMLKIFRVNIKIYSSHKIDEEYLKENNASQASLEDIFSGCDIVSIHSAMTEKTRGMIGAEHFKLLRDGALFINTARGAIVRENEMIEALRNGRFNAVLDVFEKEPLDEDSELRKLENVYCIPHMGGPTMDRRPYVTKRLADEILSVLNGNSSELEISCEAAKRMTV